jgi:hypothetical protein
MRGSCGQKSKGKRKNCPHEGFMRTENQRKEQKLSSWGVHEDKNPKERAKTVLIKAQTVI